MTYGLCCRWTIIVYVTRLPVVPHCTVNVDTYYYDKNAHE